jgi:hypothetical protein
MKAKPKAKKRVPMKPRRAWCVFSRRGKPLFVELGARPTVDDGSLFSQDGETVRRVKIVADTDG